MTKVETDHMKVFSFFLNIYLRVIGLSLQTISRLVVNFSFSKNFVKFKLVLCCFFDYE